MVQGVLMLLVASGGVLFAQVIEGETSVVNVRDTNSFLTTLVYVLIGLGVLAVVGTVVFGWFTRPKRLERNNG